MNHKVLSLPQLNRRSQAENGPAYLSERCAMSEMVKRRNARFVPMFSALPPTTDIAQYGRHVRSVPRTEAALTRQKRFYSARQSCRKFKADDGLLARFKLTASALLDAPSSDGGHAGTKPNGFE
jgi:hypothetical protein